MPHEVPRDDYGLAQSQGTSSLCGYVLGLGEVKKGSTVKTLPTGPGNLDPGASSAFPGQTAVARPLS